MSKPTLKDLRTTYRVLSQMGEEVPQSLLITLAEQIKAEEKSRQYRKIARMSEEDLIRYQATPKRRLRINLPDGRIIQEKTNENTFYKALQELDPIQTSALELKIKSRPIFVLFDEPRKQLNGHKMLREGFFVLRQLKSEERLQILKKLEEKLKLNWDIILM